MPMTIHRWRSTMPPTTTTASDHRHEQMRKCAAVHAAVVRLLLLQLLARKAAVATEAARPGSWALLLDNAGIASMHTAVTHYGNVMFLDRTNAGPSRINGTRCKDDTADPIAPHDCTAHSVVFTPNGTAGSSVRPLFVASDTWCSSGQFAANGTIVQTGGNGDGIARVRTFAPCASSGNCDWVESTDTYLADGRWYASNQLLPDGRQIVVGGRAAFTYEFVPGSSKPASFYLPLLNETSDAQEDNLYPFVHLLPDGTLFVFANRDSIVFDYVMGRVVRALPRIPGREPRNYPSAGSSVMLPLDLNAETAENGRGFGRVEVLVCGGAQPGCFAAAPATTGGPFPRASRTCGRIAPLSCDPRWAMERMPEPRTMGDMLFLADGNVLIVNGAHRGCQGWGNADRPALSPLVYRASAPAGSRFVRHAPSSIPRLYHSTANLLPDGSVLVAGGNSHEFYTFVGVRFPTELRVEAFFPAYLHPRHNGLRPSITAAPSAVAYASSFQIFVAVSNYSSSSSSGDGRGYGGGGYGGGGGSNATARTRKEGKERSMMGVNLVSSPFATHSFSQGLRFLRLRVTQQTALGGNGNGNGVAYALTVQSPPSPAMAPPSFYMLFVENAGIPSASAAWIRIM